MSRKSVAGNGNAFLQFYRYVLGIGYERNVGGWERTLRYGSGAMAVFIGVVLAVFQVVSPPVANSLLAIVLGGGGVYLIYEARVQYCPLNHTLQRSTYGAD